MSGYIYTYTEYIYIFLLFLSISTLLCARCAAAVKLEWKTVEDSVQFWSTYYNDDEALKLDLVRTMAKISVQPVPPVTPVPQCHGCLLPKESTRCDCLQNSSILFLFFHHRMLCRMLQNPDFSYTEIFFFHISYF